MLVTEVDPYFGRQHSRGQRSAHNVYLATLAELGLVGFVVLAGALVAHARTAWRLRREAHAAGDPRHARLALTLAALVTSVAIFGNTIDLLGAKLPWLILALVEGAAFAPPPASPEVA
jgi:O-antigen ligase